MKNSYIKYIDIDKSDVNFQQCDGQINYNIADDNFYQYAKSVFEAYTLKMVYCSQYNIK